MKLLFKNPWVWLLVLFLGVSAVAGVFLFREESVTTVERGTVGANDYSSLSESDSEDIVRKLEEGSEVPEEEEERIKNEELGMENSEEQETSPPAGGNEQEAMNNEQRTRSEEQGVKGNEQESGNDEQKETSGGDVKSTDRLVSWGFEKANDRKIDTVVIHSTYNALGGDPFSVSKILDIYKSYGVAPHYLVSRDGTTYRLVDEKNISYHAGESRMKDGRKNVNGFSIGIEIIGKDDGSPSEAQYASLTRLLADLKRRHTINHIVGHSDIAPGRKSDPWGFEWEKIGGKEL